MEACNWYTVLLWLLTTTFYTSHKSSTSYDKCKCSPVQYLPVVLSETNKLPWVKQTKAGVSDTFWPLRMFVKILWMSQAQIGTQGIRSAKRITKELIALCGGRVQLPLTFLALCSSKYSATSQNHQVKMVWGWFMGYKHSSCSLTYGLLVHRYACTDLQKVHLGTHSKGYACRNTQTRTGTHWHSYMYIYKTKAGLQGKNPNLAAPKSNALSLMD